jgi:hypothetical protein
VIQMKNISRIVSSFDLPQPFVIGAIGGDDTAAFILGHEIHVGACRGIGGRCPIKSRAQEMQRSSCSAASQRPWTFITNRASRLG